MLRNNRFFFADNGTLIGTALLIAVLVLLPETVDAVPLHSASIPGIETVTNSPTPVFLSNRTERFDRDMADNVIGQATHVEVAAASYAQLRGSSNAEYQNVHPHFPLGIAGTGAQQSSGFSLDDLVITGPPGNLQVSFNYAISGSIGGMTVTTGNPAFYNWYADVKATGGIGSSFGAGGFEIGRMHANFSGAVSQSGIFSTFSVNSEGTAIGTSPPVLTFAGDTELGFSLGLETLVSVQLGYGAEPGSTNSHASFSFGFPISGPVANLPAGYTLNSADGRIVDNQFVVMAGDFDGDGDVDGADFVAWQTNFPKADGATKAQGDADGDGDVDGADFVVWQTNFPFTPAAGDSPVPEPNSLVHLLACMIVLICRRRMAPYLE